MNETCGCCEGIEPLTPLTTANRPGLNALAYRAGTHATFLETMKARLSDYPALAGLTTRAANDPAIALLDAWATVADVLTFYQERIANEGYLRTATERRSILELARLVGYALRPGVAASVYLAFTLESEDGSNVEIPVGTRAQSVPGPGELPQSFETAEKLDARAAWNILKPRRSRPQSVRQYAETRRLYLKGIATNLQPNAPLLIDFGLYQAFIRVEDVVTDPAADRTLVTLQPLVASALSSEFAGEIRQMVEHYLDLGLHEVRPGAMTRRVSGILQELRAAVERNELPERLFASVSGMLPRLREDHATAIEGRYRWLEPWVGEIVEKLQEIEERLRTGSEPTLAHALSALSASTAPTRPPAENGKTPLEKLEERLGPLAKPPSRQPSSPEKLLRSLDQSFGATSDAVPRLLATMRPELREAALYRAWEQAATQSSAVRVYALRTTALPFGHNAPRKPIIGENGTILDYEEWTLKRFADFVEERFRVNVRVAPPPDNGIPGTIQVTVAIDDESRVFGPQDVADDTFSLTFTGGTVAGTVSNVVRDDDFARGDRFLLDLDFENRQTLVKINHWVVEDEPDEDAPRAETTTSLATRITVRVAENDELEVDEFQATSDGSDPTSVAVRYDIENGDKLIEVDGKIRRYSTEQTEQENVVSLETSFDRILPESWIVLERPDAVGTISRTPITRVKQVREGSRADYGITAKGTQITLGGDWIHLQQDTFAVIRGTSVHAQSELLELAEAPLEEIDDEGVPMVEPVGGKQVELDALYDGLEPGRWLIVTGERKDLPGVIASELVMLAGVSQGVEPTISGRGSTGRGGYDLTVSARLLPDGSATGYAHLAGGATGNVVQVVPPSGARSFWCVNVKRTDTDSNSGDQRINWYIRDIGDGITSFDEITFVSGIGVDCDNNPDPPSWGAWIPLTEGDFNATTDLPGDRIHTTLILANDLAYSYKRETVEIFGNVARATHGASRVEVLGSGDGSQALQRFGLKQSPLTFVAATTPTGTQSTLKIYVDDVRWHEAERPAGLKPTDRRFVTQADDQDQMTIIFGEGARLPTGMENVRAEYRTGIGQAGNVARKQINLLATTLPLGLKGVTNPLPATGGADRDSRDQARRNAPLALMALDRLVSVPDYEDFARTFAGIGKASAIRISDGNRQLVHVTVAGAGDIPIAQDSDLYRNLDQALRQFGDPHQPLRVDVRELILLIISAGVRVLPDYRWESVEPKIRTALLDTFSFERRELGQDALLSEVIGAIQHVPGVAYVDVDTFGPLQKTTGADVLLTEIPGVIQALAAEGRPRPRVVVELARPREGAIRPAQLAFLTPRVPDTLILREV